LKHSSPEIIFISFNYKWSEENLYTKSLKIILPGIIVFLISTSTICRAQENSDNSKQFPVLKGAYLGQKPPGMTPELFAPGAFSAFKTVASIAFTPDGREVYFATRTPEARDLNIIMFMKLTNNQWNEPKSAPFSGIYRDWNINLSPDGNRLYYTSRRPLSGKGEPKRDNDIWYVEKTNGGWEEPQNIGPPINTDKMDCYASPAANGTLYYHGFNYKGGAGGADIYRSYFVNGKYMNPENLGDRINSNNHDWDVFVAPDESYLIFCSVSRQDSFGESDLYISFHQPDGSWTSAKNMGNTINSKANEICPSVTLDGKYLFFTKAQKGRGDVYWVDAQIIKRLKLNSFE